MNVFQVQQSNQGGMNMKKWWLITLLLVSLAFTVGIFVGQHSVNVPNAITFYGKVLDKDENNLHIKGIPENDINHRGEFIIANKNIEGVYNEQGEKITVDQLKVDSEVRITYDGIVLESYPSQITHVIRIDVLQN